MVLTMMGGILGLGLAYGVNALIATAAAGALEGPPVVSMSVAIGSIIFSACVELSSVSYQQARHQNSIRLKLFAMNKIINRKNKMDISLSCFSMDFSIEITKNVV